MVAKMDGIAQKLFTGTAFMLRTSRQEETAKNTLFLLVRKGGTAPTDRKALKNMRRTSSLLVRTMRRTSATDRKTCNAPVRCARLYQSYITMFHQN